MLDASFYVAWIFNLAHLIPLPTKGLRSTKVQPSIEAHVHDNIHIIQCCSQTKKSDPRKIYNQQHRRAQNLAHHHSQSRVLRILRYIHKHRINSRSVTAGEPGSILRTEVKLDLHTLLHLDTWETSSVHCSPAHYDRKNKSCK